MGVSVQEVVVDKWRPQCAAQQRPLTNVVKVHYMEALEVVTACAAGDCTDASESYMEDARSPDRSHTDHQEELEVMIMGISLQ